MEGRMRMLGRRGCGELRVGQGHGLWVRALMIKKKEGMNYNK